jgi:hypothetical protein
VTLAGFLLGTVSGSGVATTVTLAPLGWPLLRRAGYSAEAGGAVLAAAGIGALLSPPTMGAAAFLIAEFLEISYLQVLVMATLPTLLYYLSAFLMVEADARAMGARVSSPPCCGHGYPLRLPLQLAADGGGLMALGMTASARSSGRSRPLLLSGARRPRWAAAAAGRAGGRPRGGHDRPPRPRPASWSAWSGSRGWPERPVCRRAGRRHHASTVPLSAGRGC